MKESSINKLAISGTPVIGEGNLVDNKALINVLSRVGIPCISIYPNGPLVWLARWFHVGMSMNTKKTMDYALTSEATRSSLKVLPLKLELRRAIKKVYETYPNAICFVTSQSIMAEESVGCIGDIPTININSDVSSKFSYESKPSERQKKIIYLVWNKEALDLYKNTLKLQNVHLVIPVDPKDAFEHIERDNLPFQQALNNLNICFVKLSGSGGDSKLINAAIFSLFKKSGVRSIIFPGTEKTQRKLIKTLGENVEVNTCLDTSVFYNHSREMISNKQMLLTYPSEQVKHVAVLSQNNIFPKVVWLPPRGKHEVINLAWAMKKGFSGTVCIPEQYHSQLSLELINLGISASEFEFVVPEKLSAEHFKPSPKWQCQIDAIPFENIIRKLVGT
jgi:hypothetical protein